MHQVSIDIEHRRPVVLDVDNVVVPKLVVKRSGLQRFGTIHTRTIMPSESGTSAWSTRLSTTQEIQ